MGREREREREREIQRQRQIDRFKTQTHSKTDSQTHDTLCSMPNQFTAYCASYCLGCLFGNSRLMLAAHVVCSKRIHLAMQVAVLDTAVSAHDAIDCQCDRLGGAPVGSDTVVSIAVSECLPEFVSGYLSLNVSVS